MKTCNSEKIKSLPKGTRCRVRYQNEKIAVTQRVEHINWNKRVLSMTILFDHPRYYMINGDACKRDGSRVVVNR